MSLLWTNKPPSPLSPNPALKHVQTPHPQSAGMLISWEQSRGVYKTPMKADFSAELLLTQPAVNTGALSTFLDFNIGHVELMSIFFFFYFPSVCLAVVLPVSQAAAPALSPRTWFLGSPPRLLGRPDELPWSLFPVVLPGLPRLSLARPLGSCFHGPSIRSSQRLQELFPCVTSLFVHLSRREN